MKGRQVGVGGMAPRGAGTSPTTLGSTKLKRRATSVSDHISEQMKDPDFKKSYDECEIPTTEKNKKDLSQICDCAIKAPMHTVGYHKAVMEAV